MCELVCVYCVGVEGMTALNQAFSFVSVLSFSVLWYPTEIPVPGEGMRYGRMSDSVMKEA